MPACVEEIGGATAAVATGRARHAIVKRLPWGKRVNEPVTAVEMRLLAAVDGALSLRSLVDVSGMPESDVLTVIDRLVRLRIVTIE